MAESYQDLMVWQKGMDLAEEIYRLVKLMPKEETYALSDQMRRAAISVPSNIAEGKNRNSQKEFKQFLSVARGSAAELETQLLLSVRIDYLKAEDINCAVLLCKEVGKMLNSLMNSITPCSLQLGACSFYRMEEGFYVIGNA